MSTQPTTFLTPEAYLEIERKADFKSEYYRGEMFAMAGALEANNLIVSNFIGQMYQQLRGRQCRLYPGDMRLRVSDTGLYTYPDSAIVCGERQVASVVREPKRGSCRAAIPRMSPETGRSL